MFRSLIAQLLISVIFEDGKHAVRARSIRGDKVVKTYEKSFEDKKKLLKYVDNLSQNFQIYYISAFFDASEQGLAPASSAGELERYGVSVKNTQSISLLNAQIYAPKVSIKQYERLFEDYGELDLLFSPFMLLYHCINTKIKPKKDKNTLFVFRHSNYLAMMICEDKRIAYGKFFDLSTFEENLDGEEINLDDIDTNAPDTEAGEQVAGMLRESASENSGENSANSSENSANSGENSPEAANLSTNPLQAVDLEKEQAPNDDISGVSLDESKHIASSAMDLSNFGSDMTMCSCMFSGVQDFYTNPLYNGKFIDELVLFDSADISQAVLDYIEGEIFIKPAVVKIDTLDLMNDLMCRELEI